jgi:replication factor C subunit 3/5
MYTDIDKYRPASLDSVDFGHDVSKFLKALAKNDLPHMIIEGCRGSGKSLRTMLFLQEKFGPFTVKHINLTITIPGSYEERTINIIASPYHYQINPTMHNIYDRALIQAITTEIIKYKVLSDKVEYRILVIEDADMLSIEAQESLRRTLEVYIKTCRFIFIVNREDKLIDPLLSRCVRVKVPSPTINELTTMLSKISGDTPQQVIQSIAKQSNRNVSKAISYLEKHVMSGDSTFDINSMDSIHKLTTEIIQTIIHGRDIEATLDQIRNMIYDLVTYSLDSRNVIPVILSAALQRIPKHEVTAIYDLLAIASERDKTIRSSSKPMYHIESFCLHLFNIIKGLN